MFLEAVKKYNRKLIDVSLELHQQGSISPNTYVLDLDMIRKNAVALNKKAKKLDIELFFMTKQFGRNPVVTEAIVEAGIKKAVAVDPWEAITLSKTSVKLGHVGHLVQIPKQMISPILDLSPEFITVFSYENAKNISDIAWQKGIKQKIFLRIANKGDFVFNGQEGGFTLAQLAEDFKRIKHLEGVELAGLTSFPCIVIENDVPMVTANVTSMQKAKEFLIANGHTNLEMNMPSGTSVATMDILKKNGATQGEPGHALTGTTPLHASKELAEKPAIVYVTEVSHIYNNHAYVFGGGFYPRSHMKNALVGASKDHLREVRIIENDPTNIDYYGKLATENVEVGDTALYAFRTQIFVTNAQIAVVEGISSKPKLIGIYDSMGRLIRRDV
ncbi:YhfX family PLP-dependent enzyme [Virgibacillus proomii]|uniref:YhfX family PLP-dependent enzyme n=1 Tax=Virgibacillus proomii TaxID=84407 RepID=UPI001C128D7B|nr:YhfX family PLP-dependent enzyme [Virgibacillus proomii]MBU5268083.1 YhfX family PLP-dependent enzyme [Virgibacillus proomii]